MIIKSIIFGATGMVGEGVMDVALRHPEVESVLVVGRKSCGVKHRKLRELVHADFFNWNSVEEDLKGYTACFFCLGVSSVGMNEQDYTRMTYDLTMNAAKTLVRLNPQMTFCYVSGTGTDSTEKGKMMWARVKGKTENDIAKLPFKATYAFRPGYIKPIRGLKRAHWFSTAVAPAYPIMRLLAPNQACTLEDLGLAMIRVTAHGYQKRVLENSDITSLAQLKAE